LDLVQIAFKDVPICQILDYGKFKYSQHKKLVELKKKQPKHVVKEIKLTPRIEQHDVDIKIKRTKELLDDNCTVRVSMFFKGRENNYKVNGLKILEMFKMQGYNNTEIKQEGNVISMTLTKITP